MISVFLLLAVVALFLAYRHWRRSEQTQRDLKVYVDRVAAADVDVPLVPEKIWRGHRKVPELLRSRRFGLVGKPDYVLVDDEGRYFPVELKNRRAPRQPLESDVAQLWSYCFLLEENGFPTIGGGNPLPEPNLPDAVLARIENFSFGAFRRYAAVSA